MSWKKLSSKTVYDNPYITVFEDHVLNPGGGENQYGHVHFKNKAIAIVPLDEDGNTWLVGQGRYTLGEYSWELPMGGARENEEPLAAAKRELKEETGITAAKWDNVLKIHTSNSVTDEVGFVFLATELSFGESQLEETESDLIIKKLPFKEALEMVENSQITDSISQSGIFKVARLLKL